MNFQRFISTIWIVNSNSRSNQMATTLAIQVFSQLRKDYGKENADVIINITGNIISGKVVGETSKLLSGRFGKIMQNWQSISINRTGTSVRHLKQLHSAIPSSKTRLHSSGEFVGFLRRPGLTYNSLSLK